MAKKKQSRQAALKAAFEEMYRPAIEMPDIPDIPGRSILVEWYEALSAFEAARLRYAEFRKPTGGQMVRVSDREEIARESFDAAHARLATASERVRDKLMIPRGLPELVVFRRLEERHGGRELTDAADQAVRTLFSPMADPWPSNLPRITVDVSGKTAFVDGESHALAGDRQPEILSAIVAARGGWVSSTELRQYPDSEERIGRIIDNLPAKIRSLIQGKRGLGYRLRPLA